MVKSDFLDEAEAFSAFLQIYAKDHRSDRGKI